MNTQKNQNRSRNLIVKVILGFIIGISFGFGIVKMVKSNDSETAAIERTLQQNCDCESITLNHSAIGIQFSNADGFSNKKLSFTLKNCRYKSSAKEEASRLNELLKRDVENYNSVDFISLYFKSEERDTILKIKRGTIL